MIPSDTKEAIRARLNIVDLIGEYVTPLQRAGRNMKGRCPFHQERTPSFIINAERQTYHCFGCGEGGDAFAFLMKMENLSFVEALEKLAERTGVKIEPSSEALGPAEKERIKIKELLGLACEYYSKTLASASGAAARAYLTGRHVSAEALEAFKVGYAPKQGELHKKAAAKGYSKELLIKAGLAAEAKDGSGRLRDYFYDRVLYPIFDTKGAVVGFGARTMGDGMPKYLNSPDSPVFSKGRVLYGLSHGLSAIRKSRRALLMEGYMDVMAAHQHGLSEACAPLGTALTPEHAALIKRYAGEAIIVFDADSAGLNAAVRGAEILLAEGLAVRIATVPQGKDPDEHLHQFGVASFKACLAKAVDLVDFKTELLLKAYSGPLSAQEKSIVAKQVLSTIAQSPDEIMKAEWSRRLSQRLGVTEEALRKELGKTESAPSRSRAPIKARAAGPEPVGEADVQILEHLFKKPALAALVWESDLASDAARRLWKALCGVNAKEEGWSSRLLESLAETDKAAGSRFLVDDKTLEDHEQVLTAILTERRTSARYNELRSRVMDGSLTEGPELDEYSRLATALKGSKR